jgi:chromosome segregation ATPase
MTMTELEIAERELGKLVTRRRELEERHRASTAALEAARKSRRDALVKGTAEKQIEAVDRQISNDREAVESLEDALRELDTQISMGTDALSDLRDHQVREAEIGVIRERMTELEKAATAYIEAAKSFRSALNGISDRHAEAGGLAALIGEVTDLRPMSDVRTGFAIP